MIIPSGGLNFSPAVDFDMSIGFPGVVEHLRGTVSGKPEINPNTVTRAYRELEADGYIVGKRGVGTFPAEEEPAAAPAPADRERVLRGIFERAWAEAARHRIGLSELRAYFRKAERLGRT